LALLPILSRLYDATDLEGVKYHLSQSLRHYLILAIPAVAALTVLSPVLLSTLTTPEFVSGSTVLPLIAMTGALGGANMIISNILFLVKKTHLELVVHVLAAVAVVALNLLLIPTLGILGAALAGLLAYVIMTLLTVHYSFRYLRFPLDVGSVIKSAGSALAMTVVILLLSPQGFTELIASIAIGSAVYLIAMIALKGLNVSEVGMIRAWARRALSLFNMGS
jgi:O-antigen/teichoic acid export membrane protein